MPNPPRRPMLLSLFAAIASLVLITTAAQARPVQAEGPSMGDAIVDAAFDYLDTWQGQCWTFMKKVIEEATGKTVGFDYRLGYFEAGAYEVSISNAQPGDIIQLADDADTSPNADYPGLHTAIIYKVLGGGKFMVIDSNANYDEWVGTREYDPAAAAARYPNIDVHIYRFGGTPPPGPVELPPSRRPELRVGDTATVATPGECLNIRSGAGTEYELLDCLDHHTQVKITKTVVTVEGRRWVAVSTGSYSGWVAADYLEKAPVAGSGSGSGVMPATTFKLFLGMVGSD